MSVFPESSFAVVASCCCCACQSLWCQLLHWCSGVVPLHKSLQCHCFALVGPLVWCTTCRCLWHHLHRWGQLVVHYMQVSVASFAQVGPVVGALHAGVCGIICTGGASCWCTTCRCLWHHLHWWGQLLVHYMQVSVASFALVGPVVGALHAGVCGIICTGGASCWCTTCRCLWHHLHWWGQLLVHYMQVSVASFALVGPVVAVLHAGVCSIIYPGGATCCCAECRCLRHHLHWAPAAQVSLWWCR